MGKQRYSITSIATNASQSKFQAFRKKKLRRTTTRDTITQLRRQRSDISVANRCKTIVQNGCKDWHTTLASGWARTTTNASKTVRLEGEQGAWAIGILPLGRYTGKNGYLGAEGDVKVGWGYRRTGSICYEGVSIQSGLAKLKATDKVTVLLDNCTLSYKVNGEPQGSAIPLPTDTKVRMAVSLFGKGS